MNVCVSLSLSQVNLRLKRILEYVIGLQNVIEINESPRAVDRGQNELMATQIRLYILFIILLLFIIICNNTSNVCLIFKEIHPDK